VTTSTATSTVWCEHAWLGGDDVVDGVVLSVAGGVFDGIEPGIAAPPAGAARLDGLTLPGFANGHSHAFHRALRGRTHRRGGTFWTWREQMYDLAGNLDPERCEALAEATYAEMVLSGYTCVGEFHYLHHGPGGTPYADDNEIGHRLIAAARRAGIRLTLLDSCYLSGGINGQLDPVQTRFSDGTADAWADRATELAAAASGALGYRIGAAIHSVRAVRPEAAAVVAVWAGDRGAVLHAHVSEQPQENADCLATYGCTPVELLDRAGALGSRFTAVHATHLDDDDVGRLATSGSRCCICPTTERDLADGIGPTAALRDAGVDLCLGSDSHAVIDPFEETRAIELDQRLASRRRGVHDGAELARAATSNGYESLGWSGGGRLAAGAPADFLTVSLNSPRLAGSDRHGNLLAAVLFAASPADVRHVFVGGEHVVADGSHRTIDVPAALNTSITAAWQHGR
jgi:formiminoglutamate deiminase